MNRLLGSVEPSLSISLEGLGLRGVIHLRVLGDIFLDQKSGPISVIFPRNGPNLRNPTVGF